MSPAPLLLLLLPLALLALQLFLRRRLSQASDLRSALKHDRPPSPGAVPWATEVDLSSCPLFISERFLAPLDARGYFLVFDTETRDAIDERAESGKPLPSPSPVIALSWQVLDEEGRLLSEEYHLLQQPGRISPEATALHGLREEELQARGETPREVLARFLREVERAQVLVAHHLRFHLAMVRSDLTACGLPTESLTTKDGYCTMEAGKALGFKRRSSGEALYPGLGELFAQLYYGRPRITLRYEAKGLRDVRLATACLRALRQLPAYLTLAELATPQEGVSSLD